VKFPIKRSRSRFGRGHKGFAHYVVEALERRTLLNAYVVTNVNNSGDGSLRDAITQANDNPGLDFINFNIPGAGVHTITPAFFLPAITDPVEIHGETQPGYTDHPLIELDGSQAGNSNGLDFETGGNFVEGLDIHSFTYDGIVFAQPNSADATGGNTAFDNYLGTDPTGTVAEGNGFDGIHLVNSPHDLIDGNLISGNIADGIFVAYQLSTDTHIENNLIGTDVTGLKDLGNGLSGVDLSAPLSPVPAQGDGFTSGNFVGGTLPGQRNIISGNDQSGVFIEGGSNNVVLGNYIGVGVDGLTDVGNGVLGNIADPRFGIAGVYIVNATNNEVGGDVAGARNIIAANFGDGVEIDAGSSGNQVDGNYIGTNASGEAALPNDGNGVNVLDSTGNTIGGDTPGTRNIISGNKTAGVRLYSTSPFFGPANNKVLGNIIGLDATGVLAIPNENDGVDITSDSNIIGGMTAAARNVISGNSWNGIDIFLPDSNVVEGNYIGTDITGLIARPNELDGIHVSGSYNVIGGTTAGARNVISGNVDDGIDILASPSTGNLVEGNYIGTDSTGLAALHNGQQGVSIYYAPLNVIGGITAAAGNVISGNGQDGVLIQGSTATGNIVEGNFIGTDITGEAALANVLNGVEIEGAALNIIGGAATLAGSAPGNLISGNEGSGIYIQAAATSNSVLGNLIGLDEIGVTALPNKNSGVFIDSSSGNIIGSAVAGARNVISGNVGQGVVINGTSATNNTVSGNYIGTDISGLLDRPNTVNGVAIANSPTNVIGGTTVAARNVISGNTNDGVTIQGSAATGNLVEGNYIGTDLTGETAVHNGRHGVSIFDASGNTIGGAASPLGTPPGNVISGNIAMGVLISGAATGTAAGNKVFGNLIGVDQNGIHALPNQQNGVLIQSAASNFIGFGTTGNVISGNGGDGIVISGDGATKNAVSDNYIGTDITGTSPLKNVVDGILINNVPNNTIGSSLTDRNVISGNGGSGVHILGSKASGNTVEGNFIGTDSTGAVELPNQGDGVLIDNARGNIIGGIEVGQDNVISGNIDDGVDITGPGALNNKIQHNFIGTDVTATLKIGNQDYGVDVRNDGNNNLIGGNATAFGNTIAFNGAAFGARGYGVEVVANDQNAIRENSIFQNAGRGIDLVNVDNPDTFTINTLQTADNPTNPVQDAPVVTRTVTIGSVTYTTWKLNSTPKTTFTIDFFANTEPDPSGFGDGRTFLTSATYTTDADGNVSFSQGFSSSDQFLSTTATDPANNTSEFSMVDSDADGLADTWETRGIDFNEDGIVDLTLPGANPMHKDVFVEIDSMVGFEPNSDALELVKDAFAAAPVDNPDGTAGIALHLEVDETNIPDQKWIGDLNGDGVIDDFDLDPFNWFAPVKANGIDGIGGFGTAAERQNPAAMAAKALTYRYAIFADQMQIQRTDTPGISYDTPGVAEGVPGNDMILAMGGFDAAPGTESPDTPEIAAAAFMHELGHLLGLDHGGGDDVNNKPNYKSIMNYSWTYPSDWMNEDTNQNGIRDFFDINGNGVQDPGEPFIEFDYNGNHTYNDSIYSLDFSDTQLPPLNENALDESAGIGGSSFDWFALSGQDRPYIPMNGSVDWNNNGKIDPGTVSADINGDGPPLTTLTGYDDWTNLDYYFRETVGAESGGAAPNLDTITFSQWEAINAEGTGPGVLELHETAKSVNEGDGQVVFTVLRGAGTTGTVTVDYTTSDGTAEAGSDYAPVSGTLTFAPGEYVKTITIPIIDDNYAENTENFHLTLSHATGGAEIRQDESSSVVNIVDNDTNKIFVVTNTNDSGPGSLRQAIIDSNNNFAQNLIDFNIPGSGVQTIVPLSPLPTLTDPVTIDGTSQPGYAGKPLIQIDGVSAAGDGLDVTAYNTMIRGLAITRFFYGIGLSGFNFDVEGNYFGTADGMSPLGNHFGIGIFGGSGLIGGTTPDAANVISGNTLDGVVVGGPQSLSIEGNLIGVAADGVSALGNGDNGVILFAETANTTIGGLDPGDANVIAFNQGSGIGSYDDGFACLSNRIYSNAYLGINFLGSFYLNDSGATDGAQSQQNYPVLSSAISAAGQTVISGYLNSAPDQTFLLQFFSNTTPTASGFGQGQTFLGNASVTTDDNGHVDFTATLNVAVPNGRLITATATGQENDTSGFSLRLAVGDVLGNVYVVNTTDDTDDGALNPEHMTLRDAMLAADNHPGLDTIEFDIPGSGVQTISPLVPLPAITDSVVIDGTTQPGYAGLPLIQISGSKMERTDLSGSPLLLTGLYIYNTNNCTVKGLIINSFFKLPTNTSAGAGSPLDIIFGNDNVVEGNFIGTDPTGTLSMPNLVGVLVEGAGNVIGGTTPAERNIISGNYYSGLNVQGFSPALGSATGAPNVIEGNFIGTDVTGTQALGNGIGTAFNSVGLAISGATILGGSAPGAGNVISGNNGTAVTLSSTEGSVIQGNFIGTDVTGTKKIGNGGPGIVINDNDFEATSGVTIGGTQAGEGNIISNNESGLTINGSLNVIQGNLIGTDITGRLDFGNFNDGIDVQGNSNTIGGTDPGAGNVISGNGSYGILLTIFGLSTSGNVIQGNRIGTQADGVSPLGNHRDGIEIVGVQPISAPVDALIGGTDSGAANIIAFNGRDGVDMQAVQNIGILSNSIFSNASLGIDLGGDGVTPNDLNDADSGANNLQNYPVLDTVVTDGVGSTITGSFNSTPDTVFRLQFFTNAAADPSGNGQGQTFIGTRQLITDSNGNANFVFNFPVAVTVDQFISATATDSSNNTSEFSADIQIATGTVAPNQPPTSDAGGPYTINEGDSLTLDASRSSDPDGDPLTYSWDINGDGVFGDATGVKPTLTWTQLQALGIVNGPSSFSPQVRVDDGQGHVVTSSPTTLSVLNVAPTPDAGPDLYVNEEDTVTLTGTFTDPGTFDTHTLNWHVVADNGQVISDGTDSTFSFVPDDNGTYVVTFSVTDSDGGVGTAVVNVNVLDVNPVASIVGLPTQGTVGVPVNLTSTVTDISPIDTAAGFQYFWQAILETDDSVYFFAQTPDFSFTPPEAGTYDIILEANDKDGGPSFVFSTLDVSSTTGITPTVTAIDAGGVYNGNPYSATATVTGTGDVSITDGTVTFAYYLASDTTFSSPLSGAPTDAGSYSVIASFSGDADYSSADSAPTLFTITPATPTVSVTDAGGVYTGSPFSATGSVTGVGNAPLGTPTFAYYLASDTTFSSPLSGAPTNVGSYVVVASFAASGNYGAASKQTGFTITVATPIVSVTDNGGAYTGTPYAATGSVTGVGNAPLGTPTFTYYLASDTTFSSPLGGAPTNVGSYVVVASYAATADYIAASNQTSFSITPATPTVSVTDSDGVYTGSPFSATGSVAGVGNAPLGTPTFAYYLASDTTFSSALSGAPTNVGSYVVVASYAATTDYIAASNQTSFSITPATPTVSVTDSGGVYTGSPFFATGSAAGVGNAPLGTPTFAYYLASDTTFSSPLSGAPTNVGSYVVVASFAASGNYGAASAQKTFAITPATPTVSVTDSGGVYTGSPFSATGSVTGVGNAPLGTPTFTYYLASDTTFSSPLSGAPTNVGSYVVVASYAATTDYIAASNQTSFSITPATPTVSVTDSGGVYTGSPFTATGSVTGVGNAPLGTPTFAYYLASDTTFSSPLGGAPTNVGSYVVVASFAASGNYGAASAQKTFAITPATPIVSVTDNGGAYTGSPFSATGSVAGVGNAPLGTPTFAYYLASDTTFSSPLSGAPTNVGSYVVVASFAASGNYGAASTQKGFAITVATPTISVTDAGGVSTGSAFPATALVKGVGPGATFGPSLEGVFPTLTYYAGLTATGTPLAGAPVNPGSYTVVANFAGSADYAAASNSTTFTITSATTTTAKVILSNLNQTYNGAAKSVTVTTTPSGLATIVTYSQNNVAVAAPTNAGSYTVTATVNSPSYTGSATGTFVIAKANAIITVTGLTTTYNGSAHPASGSAAGVETPTPANLTSLLNLSYKNLATNVISTSAPVNAGTYEVFASFAGNANYNSIASFDTGKKVVINAIGPAFSNLSNLTIILHTSSVTLSGKILAGSLIPAGAVSIKLNGVTHTATIAANGAFSVTFSTIVLPVGAYTVQYTYAGSSNFAAASATSIVNVTYGVKLEYNNSVTYKAGSTIPLAILLVDANGNDANTTKTTVTATGLALASSPNTPVAIPAGNPAGGKFTPDNDGDEWFFNFKTTGLAAGTYVLTYTISGDPIVHTLTFIVGH